MMKKILAACLSLAVLLSLAPTGLAQADLNAYATGNFSRVYSVYSGPGEYYCRANNGKAAYGGGTARIYGITGDWIMIGYGLSNGDFRIGYIAKDALKTLTDLKGTIKEPLSFTSVTAVADDYCRLTDDPVKNNKMIYTIPEGTEVTVLARMGNDWTYVETATPNGYMRGFVWSIHLSYPAAAQTAAPAVQPYILPGIPAAAAAPQAGNSFYHPVGKGHWLPVHGEVYLEGSWPVYSGPGEEYYRANGGRATMGGGACRVFGVENDWVLIGYQLSNGQYRIGYVQAQALPQKGLNLPYLDLSYLLCRSKEDAQLTDDPIRFQPSLAAVPAGSFMLFLGYTAHENTVWAYVETLIGGESTRGFIPASALDPM